MNASENNGEAPQKHTGASGREFETSNPIPYYAFSAPDKRALPDQVLRAIVNTPETSLVRLNFIEIPPREGGAIRVAAGSLIRLTLPSGPQTATINVWNAGDPLECFFAGKTREIHSSHLTVGDSLWSSVPYVRPLLTITADSLGYGIDSDGAGCHDVIGTRSDPYTHALMTGDSINDTCHSNLVRAVAGQGLKEEDVHDPLNAFVCSGFSKDKGVYFVKRSPARASDYLDFFAHVDVIFAVSASRQGDFSVACGDKSAEPTCFPLGLEVYQIPMAALEGWTTPKISGYDGTHGIAPKVV